MKLKRSLTIFSYLLLSVGIVSISTSVFALASVDFAIEQICQHMQGNLGGLLMVAAGVGGIISAAFGNMKALYSCLITAIAAFSISSILSLYPQFDSAYRKCRGPQGFDGFQGDINPGAFGNVARVSEINEVEAANQFLNLSRTNNAPQPQSGDYGDVPQDSDDIFTNVD